MSISTSDEIPGKTQSAPSPYLHRPTSLRAVYSNTLQQGGRITLTWHDNSYDELVFRIQRKTGLMGDWVHFGTTGPNATSYMDYDVTPNQTYYYRVQFSREGYDSPYSNVASASVGDIVVAGSINTK